jgi:hypothetical protein
VKSSSFEPALGLLDARGTRARDRLRLFRALLVELPLGLAQPGAAAVARRQLARQLVTAALAEALVLLRVDRVCLFEDLLGKLLVAARGVAARVRVELGRVDAEHGRLRDPGLGAERQHVAE